LQTPSAFALAIHVGFEFGEHAEHVKETFSGAVPVSTGGAEG
jgi:hypothetical protein